jgi:hypothetical protein
MTYFEDKNFETRVIEAFGYKSIQDIAVLMEVNHFTLRNWLKNKREIPPNELAKIAILTNFSLNWILTGEGQKETAKPKTPTILNEDNLAAFIRGIVQSELEKRTHLTLPIDLRTDEQKSQDKKAG